MPAFEPQDPDFEARVRASFAKQKLMKTIGASVTKVSPGEVEIELPFRKDLTQQHDFLHGGIVATIVDTACGYAALSLMPVGSAVLTIEYKVNFVSPATGKRLIARGHVAKPGRIVTVCAGDVYAVSDGKEKLVATMLTTMMALRDRADVSG
ncbi:MAG: PaaI family thioesterase [candidate division NC10 bacterium]|nr:PaaI family thioesterase [candidate division NC10 bacterium]